MAFLKEDDWKEFLNDDARQLLSDIFDTTRKHKSAYEHADDVKIAQLWSALIELKKDINETKKILGKLEGPWRAIVSVGDEEKKKTIERLITDIVRPTDEDTQEATKRLVESLMKF